VGDGKEVRHANLEVLVERAGGHGVGSGR
jgi:hypothetical protein